MNDRDIIALFLARSEQAITEIEKKYGRYCHYIAYRVLGSDEDAMEVVNDTYLKAWNTIPPATPDPLRPYLGMICRQLALNAYESAHTQKRGGEVLLVLDELTECLPDDSGMELGESIALQDALNRFLAAQSPKKRNIFLQRYWYGCPVFEIAGEYAMKESTVAMQLLRMRKQLKLHLQKEGFEV